MKTEMEDKKDRYYASEYVFDSRRSIVWKEITHFLQKYIPGDGAVLDLGAGYCDFINNIKAGKKYALDISPKLHEFTGDSVVAINSKATDLSEIPDESLDVVHASNLLEHFDDEELSVLMSEVKRVLKKGSGRLILVQPNYKLSYKNYFDDPTHKKVFSDTALKVFLQMHDMKIVLAKAKFLPFSMKSNSSLIPNFLLPIIVRFYIRSPWKPFAGQMLFIAEKI